MRKYGGILLLGGILGAFYSGSRLQTAQPVPEDVHAFAALDHDAGRWSVARYGCYAAAALGCLMLLFPRGR